MRLDDDSGLSLSELMVVLALMGLVLAAVYMGMQFSYRAQSVAEMQAHFSSEISAPIRTMDQSFSQSTVPAFGTPLEPYRARLRMPADYFPGRTIEYEYEATTDGRLVQTVYRVTGTTSSVVRRVTWSESNANRALSVPLLTYYEGSAVATSVISADSVVIEVCSRFKDTTYRDKRRIAFRNR